MTAPIFISAEFIEDHTHFGELIDALKVGFASKSIITPPRHHHDFPNTEMGADTTLLLMPAWQDGYDGGVKIVSVSPNNSQLGLPSIQGSYIYMDARTGQIKAILDAKKLTSKRTAAASALASSYLSRKDSKSMLLIGTGALSLELIRAHASVRPIEKVYVWGRNVEKAQKVNEELSEDNYNVHAVEKIESVISEVDIISTATLSNTPLVKGDYLVSGQHIDLVGSFKPHMREADNATMEKASIYADVKEMAMKESGDLAIPIEKGIITPEDIRCDLFDLCKGAEGRQSEDEITLFKSVGHALEDLIAARYYFNKYTSQG